MILKDFGCLLIDNSRSKAYLQKLLKNGFIPGFTIYVERQKEQSTQKNTGEVKLQSLIQKAFKERKYFLYDPVFKDNSLLKEKRHTPVKYASFTPEESIIDTIKTHHLPHQVVAVSNINDGKLIEELRQSKPTYFLFGGGGILRTPILSIGKKFLHIHPGMVPFFRGSHCVEWSVLLSEQCAATAFFMNETIDGGEIIAQREFDFPELENENIPPMYSSHIRSELLIDVIKDYVAQGTFHSRKQNMSAGETYYKMHPALTNLVFHKLTKG